MLHFFINVIRMLARTLGLSSSPPIQEKEVKLSSLPPLVSTQESQFHFWELLFQATADSEGDQQVVYPLLDNQNHLLDDNFALLLGNWATIVFREVKAKQRYDFANTIAMFSELIREFPRGHKDINMEIAITGNRVAIIVFTQQAFPTDWARIQNNLGIAYCQRIRGNRADNLELAIRYYLAALEIRTPEAFPRDYVNTMANLGFVYQFSQQFNSAYDSFAHAIDMLESLRSEIVSGSGIAEDKQKLAEEWNKLYQGMVEVCLVLDNPAKAIEYVERSKAHHLAELIASHHLSSTGAMPENERNER
jgi:tetratricopeptide (TPR) repeat protein